MIKIVDSSVDGIPDYTSEIDRQIYKRLQSATVFPLGSLESDLIPPIKNFIDAFNAIQAKTAPSNPVDTFLGSLGVHFAYPHRDNLYKGILNG